jgi:TM2 domain
MRRVITVNLGGNAFQLDEDAYERLRAYVSVTEQSLGANPDRTEIIGDLERAVADHIVANRTATSTVVVTDREMELALATVGTVERSDGVPADAPAFASMPPRTAAPAWDAQRESDYTRLPIVILCFFFGWLGIHRFFVGKVGTGVLMLCTLGGLGIWIMIDLILILCGEFRDREGLKILRWT